MGGLKFVTAAQYEALLRCALNQDSYEVRDHGCTMTYELADELGGTSLDWARCRLGVRIIEDDLGVHMVPGGGK